MAKRPYTLREQRLLAEYLAAFHAGDRVMLNVRLGAPIPTPAGIPPGTELAKYLGNYRRFADALVISTNELILIESKIVAEPGIVSQLQLYGRLLRSTPELQQYSHLRLRLQVVWAVNDPVLADIARQAGVEVVVYSPAWVIDDLRARYKDHLRSTTPSYTPPAAARHQ